MPQTKAGALKSAASHYGISVDELVRLRDAGLRRCSNCKRWKALQDFHINPKQSQGRSNICRRCEKQRRDDTYFPLPQDQCKHFRGHRVPARDGDRIQAEHRVNHEVDIGHRPDPDELPCSQCGHLGSDVRHNYHHHVGYASEHHLDVVVLCVKCHRATHGPTHKGAISSRVDLSCKRCGKTFSLLESYVRLHGVQAYCSLECRYGHPINSTNGWGIQGHHGQ